MWRWVSTKPGTTIMRVASITSASATAIFGRTAEILPRSIRTSACSKFPITLSSVSTQPSLIRSGRPESAPGAGCCARVVPIIAVEAAMAPAALVPRNSRREGTDVVRQVGQMQEEKFPQPVARWCVIAILPTQLVTSWNRRAASSSRVILSYGRLRSVPGYNRQALPSQPCPLGADHLVVVSCTLLPYDAQFELGRTLR